MLSTGKYLIKYSRVVFTGSEAAQVLLSIPVQSPTQRKSSSSAASSAAVLAAAAAAGDIPMGNRFGFLAGPAAQPQDALAAAYYANRLRFEQDRAGGGAGGAGGVPLAPG